MDGPGADEATGPIPGSGDTLAQTGSWRAPSFDGPTLMVRAGGPPGVLFHLADEVVTIGRDPDSHVFLDDVTVSRTHAEARIAGGRVSLRDLGSLNGTYVNRHRIEGDELLESGDEIQIGKFRLVFLT